jgi:hypothetical protein
MLGKRCIAELDPSLRSSHFIWAPVAHACNPSYSGSRDKEDCRSKPAPGQIILKALSRKKKNHTKGGVAQGVVPEFKPQYQHIHTHTPTPHTHMHTQVLILMKLYVCVSVCFTFGITFLCCLTGAMNIYVYVLFFSVL